MTIKVITPEHKKFLSSMLETGGNATKSAELAGFSKNYAYDLVEGLREELINQAESVLALHATRAAFALADGLDHESEKPLNAVRIECAKQVLDRVGIVKKEKIEVSAAENTPLFILPAKQVDDRSS
jgi:hypothetical protein